MSDRVYACVDLKSFYGSVECVERDLDPLATNLVVADLSRTEKTICLAVTPPLKAYGISGRARLFEVVQKVKEVNAQRKWKAPGRRLEGSSSNANELAANPSLALDYIVAPPRMALYIEYSTRIYEVYLKYIAPGDIHTYSIDEVMIDLTAYLKTYKTTARELVKRIIRDIYETTGITAAGGIGTNLYLAKVAMDIMAKRVEPDEDGVRIAELDEMSYRRQLWDHRPLTDFWRVGKGYAKKLEEHGMVTMGDVALCSVGMSRSYYHNEDLLYKLFGVGAETLIDHAWGWEPCTMAAIKAYTPQSKGIVSGQVLQYPYPSEKARLVVREMATGVALDLLEKRLVTDQLTLTIGYDIENLTDPERRKRYVGPITIDTYGRQIPKHSHGTANLKRQTSSEMLIAEAVMELYDRIIDQNLLIRRLTLGANRLVPEEDTAKDVPPEQLDLFTDYTALQARREKEEAELEKERRRQLAVLEIRKKFGKNAILKAASFEEGATARERNQTIGGHRAGSDEAEPHKKQK